MSPSQTPLSRDIALNQALADHRAGRLAAAEKSYRALIGADPGHAGAHHHLGVLLVQTGRMEEGLARLKSALEIDPAEPLFYFSCAKGLLAGGNPAEAGAILRQAMQRGLADGRFEPLKAEIRDCAVALYRQTLAIRPGDVVVLDNLGTALLAQAKTDEAIACYRQALAHKPDFAEAHFHLGAVLSQNGHVAEGFEHYMHRAGLVHGRGPSSSVDAPSHKIKHDLAQRHYLWGGKAAPDASQVTDMFQLAEGSRLSGPAVNPANAAAQLIGDWRRSKPQMVVIDNFLTAAALEKLRLFCAGSTVWRKIYDAGYLGAAPEDGFACPLLAQIVEEIQTVFAAILDGEPFRYLGAFKYDSELSTGTNTHADNSKVNVNFYIAPDDANLDPDSGGMQIWDAAAPDLPTMRKLNGSEEMVQAFLKRTGAKRTTIAHRANRAVIFKSTQFHKTDRFRFKNDYLSQRINISLLFGQFGEE
ncbi:MAG TPA: tetratricopeptide repeat protein [Rhizomicrobium sp.]|jgi:tetratricopeptide (TPR) repeat protein|nr:tetratricopeptide repeat protein [Rhizomicrobium sp.]